VSRRAAAIALPSIADRDTKTGVSLDPCEEMPVSKEEIRRRMQPRLRAISRDTALQAGKTIALHLEADPEWTGMTELVLFASAGGEVDSRPLFDLARRHRKTVLFPRMVEGETLECVEVEAFEDLVRGRYGVREPAAERPARPIRATALVLAPGIAFDLRGGRLGRGAGYYDRALAPIGQRRDGPRFVGVAFDLQIVHRVPMQTHDVYMDAVVTESGLYWVRPEERRGGAGQDGREGDESR
jgi:5-formyltetrahydrofolate cyclo-ligase